VSTFATLSSYAQAPFEGTIHFSSTVETKGEVDEFMTIMLENPQEIQVKGAKRLIKYEGAMLQSMGEMLLRDTDVFMVNHEKKSWNRLEATTIRKRQPEVIDLNQTDTIFDIICKKYQVNMPEQKGTSITNYVWATTDLGISNQLSDGLHQYGVEGFVVKIVREMGMPAMDSRIIVTDQIDRMERHIVNPEIFTWPDDYTQEEME